MAGDVELVTPERPVVPATHTHARTQKLEPDVEKRNRRPNRLLPVSYCIMVSVREKNTRKPIDFFSATPIIYNGHNDNNNVVRYPVSLGGTMRTRVRFVTAVGSTKAGTTEGNARFHDPSGHLPPSFPGRVNNDIGRPAQRCVPDFGVLCRVSGARRAFSKERPSGKQ